MQESGVLESCNIQNPLIFTKIRKLCYPGNWEPWHIDNPGKLTTVPYLKLNTYTHSVFQKYLKAIIIFPKRYNLDLSLTGFWISSFLIKYPLTCKVTSRYVLHETFLEPSHIQNLDIFRTPGISRTLLRHALAYWKRCITLADWAPCHMQNINFVCFSIFSRALGTVFMVVGRERRYWVSILAPMVGWQQKKNKIALAKMP